MQIFENYKDKEIIPYIKKFKKVKFQKKDLILKHGEQNNFFYLISKGRVKMKEPLNNKTLRVYDEGNCFGELSILNETPNINNFIAAENTTCYLIKSNSFFELLKEQNANDFLKKKCYLKITIYQ